ncbi:fungal-specific transcription factor domain-containing protein [Cadophora sp. MPI-SDFR-AT-0126]|nr:fungal-specific transcription factor domain-containing protein [Leotiomycetes sp. MPI-SDFR-AT-0126]
MPDWLRDMALNFQFLSNEPDKKDEDSRKIVRKTAMLAFRRKQRLEQIKKFMQQKAEDSYLSAPRAPYLSLSSTSQRGDEDRGIHGQLQVPGTPPFSWTGSRMEDSQYLDTEIAELGHSRTPSSAATRWSGDLPNGVWEICTFDPFASSPSEDYFVSQKLFSHFVRTIVPMLLPLGVNNAQNHFKTAWARHAMSDPGLYESILFHAGVHLDTLHNRPRSRTTLYHQGKVIRLLNERLTSNEDAISDLTIAMVGMTAGSGNITGEVFQDQIHWNALKRMIKMRGGLSFLGWDGALEAFLSIGDILSATITLSKPNLEAPIFDDPSDQLFPSLLNNNQYTSSADFGKGIFALLHSMSNLAALRDELSTTPGAATPAEIRSYTKARTAIEHGLLSIKFVPTSPDSALANELQLLVYESVRIAALICATYLFRDFAVQSTVQTALRIRLFERLTMSENCRQKDMTWSFAEILLWLYYIGGMVAKSGDRAWYSQRISKTMVLLGLESWAEVEDCLGRCLWTERMRDKRCIDLWQEIQGVRWRC